MDSITGRGLRVRIYFGEKDHAPGAFLGKPLWSALLEYLRREGAAGATVTRGLSGFGAHSRIHTASLVDLSSDLPLVLEWIDTQERVEKLLPGLSAILNGTGGLLTTDPVEIHRYEAHRGRH
jgi:PII-like signaling protein